MRRRGSQIPACTAEQARTHADMETHACFRTCSPGGVKMPAEGVNKREAVLPGANRRTGISPDQQDHQDNDHRDAVLLYHGRKQNQTCLSLT